VFSLIINTPFTLPLGKQSGNPNSNLFIMSLLCVIKSGDNNNTLLDGGINMLVRFRELDDHYIFFEKEFNDLSLIFEMLKQKAVMNIFFDPEGDEWVSGRLCDYEYTIEINKGRVKESLLVAFDCYDKELKKY
jgi:hypothetical protein